MAYRIEVTGRAQSDIDAAYRWLTHEAPEYAGEWLGSIEHAILS